MLQIGLEYLNELKRTSNSDSKWNKKSYQGNDFYNDEYDDEDIEFKSFSSTNVEEREEELLPLITLFSLHRN